MKHGSTTIENELADLLGLVSTRLAIAHREVLEDFLYHQEYGLLLETLGDLLMGDGRQLEPAVMAKYRTLAEKMDLPSETWERIRSLVR